MRKLALATAVALPPLALGMARADDASRPVTTTLDNGLRVVAREAKGTGLIALVCYVDGGNRTEPPELSGLSHYYEHLVFRGGTAKQAELETRKEFTRLGTFYGYTTEDSTCFYFLVPVSNLDEALWRHVDAVTKVQVTQEKVNKEREVVLSEYKMSVADSPWGSLYHDLYRVAFKAHPYGQTTIGLRDVIETCDLARFKSFYAERYVPNHMVISVVGDLPVSTLMEKVTAHWGKLEPGKASFELGKDEPAQTEARRSIEERDAVTQTYMALAFHTNGAMSRERAVDDVLAQVLSGGDSARLPLALTARRIALGASAGSPNCKDPGLFTIGLSAEPDKEKRALEGAVLVLRGVAEGGISDEELTNAKRRLATERTFGTEPLKDEAIDYAYWSVMGDPDVGTHYLDRVHAVTAEDVQREARQLFHAKGATLGVVRRKGTPAPDWDAILSGLDEAQAGPSLVVHPSGARLIFEESRRNKVVAVTVKIGGGSIAEAPGKEGVGQLVERCLQRGTRKHDRTALALEWDRLAVRISTSSSEEATMLSLRATDETLEPALALLGEMMREPVFPEDEVKKAKEETIEGLRAVEDDSYALTQQGFARALYGKDHPYGRPVAGTKESVAALTRDDLVAYFGRVYRPENMVIAVVGDIDRGQAQALVERHLLGPTSAVHDPVPLVVPPTRTTGPVFLIQDRKREQATFNLGMVTVPVSDPDYLALIVASRELGNELFFRYVYEQGIAYRMWTLLRPGIGARPLTFEMGVSAPNFLAAREGITKTLSELVERGLTSDQLAKARQDLLNRYLLARETSEDRARSLAGYELMGVGYDWEDRLPERLAKLTPEGVSAALRRHVSPDRLLMVVTGDKAALEKAGAHFDVEKEWR